jgi:hypothetical protein
MIERIESIESIDPTGAEELLELLDEVGERMENSLPALMIKHYSTAELTAFVRFAASREGQSAMQKQPAILQDTMELAEEEFKRALARRSVVDVESTDAQDALSADA